MGHDIGNLLGSSARRIGLAASVLLIGACATAPAALDGSYPAAAPQAGYPAQVAPTGAAPMQPTAQRPSLIRDFFATTLAAVLQTSSIGIASSLSGGIVNWFASRMGQNPPQQAGVYPSQYPVSSYPATSGYPSSGYPSASPGTYPSASYPSSSTGSYPSSSYPSSSYPSTSGYPTTDPSTTYPGSTYPSTGNTYPNPNDPYATSGYPSSTYPSSSTSPYPSSSYPSSSYPATSGYPTTSPYGAPQVYDRDTGQLVLANDNPYASPSESSVYAGIAYEVHALSADGHWIAVDPRTYQFRSGDRFMVYYRPSLPGRMQVYNVNPAGAQTLIDSSDMAAGQMAGLGPYEFANLTGDESLRLVLTPCSTPQLLVATRDIVKVAAPAAAQTGGGVSLPNCALATTRGVDVRTRDIKRVGIDGMTNYALDPVSAPELASGNVETREVRIVFHHR